MSQEKEPQTDLVSRSMEQLETSRRSFFRELKIGAIAVLAFQFLIFFPFVNLSREKHKLDAEIPGFKKDREILNSINGTLMSAKENLKKGGDRVSEEIKKLPDTLARQLNMLGKNLDKYIADAIKKPETASVKAEGPKNIIPPKRSLQNRSGVSSSPVDIKSIKKDLDKAIPSNPEIFVPMQFKSWSISLSGEDKKVLQKADLRDEEFYRLIKSFINKKLVTPLFEKLDNTKKQSMDQVFLHEKQRLLIAVKDNSNVLKKYKVDVSIKSSIKSIEEMLKGVKIDPPDSDNWWATYMEKSDAAGMLQKGVQESGDESRKAIDASGEELSKVSEELTDSITTSTQKLADLAREEKKLNDKLNEIKPVLENLTSTSIPVGVKEAVLYYPAALVALFVYAVWVYARLMKNGDSLARVYRVRNLPEEIMHFYFSDLLGLKKITVFSALAWAIPGILALVSSCFVIFSKSLGPEAPLSLYALSGFVLILSYIYIFSANLKTKSM